MKYLGNILLTFIFTALFLVAQPVRAETGENPLTSRVFWAEMKQTDNWQEIVQKHIDAGWDIQEVHHHFGTALQSAVVAGFVEALPVLIDDFDINVNLTNHETSNRIPLHYAATFAEDTDSPEVKAIGIEMAEILIEAGADMKAQDWNGNTPLHRAFRFGAVETINYLLDAGADQTILNYNFETPFELVFHRPEDGHLIAVFYPQNKHRFSKNLKKLRSEDVEK